MYHSITLISVFILYFWAQCIHLSGLEDHILTTLDFLYHCEGSFTLLFSHVHISESYGFVLNHSL
jgi:hypothetical protein